ncbi:MAG: radical SAM family heme chaperone HemW [Desulfobacteraceae bacterium]|nr:radical SAM family heme chaperone HemW [Desulfobacteraceae bacterium]
MCDRHAIYIHIPFCVKKCAYCDFYSQTCLSLIPDYIQSLEKEITKHSCTDTNISTIYFGGGTPSLLLVKDVENLLQVIDDNFSVSKDVELTFEVNPGTIDRNYLADLKNIGINRLSIGAQSFNDEKLKFLDRIHTAEHAQKAIEDARKAGIDNVNMDLIYGLEFETSSLWINDLNKAIKMDPSHLSCYMLTIEPGTPLGKKYKTKRSKKGRAHPIESTKMSTLFKKTSQLLCESGFEHYEISNFSKGRHHRSKHNSKYWDMTPYFGFGAAAHAYDGKKRSWNYRSIKTYIKDINSGKLPVEDEEMLTLDQQMMEMVMLRLRTLEGLDLEKFQTLFHISFEKKFEDTLKSILKERFGFFNDNRFALTLDGKSHLNGIVEAFAKGIY